jgi:hypothetical protein
MSAERSEEMRAFLKSAGWGDAAVTPLPGDASTRRYFRVAQGGRKAMLMDQPQHAETPVAAATRWRNSIAIRRPHCCRPTRRCTPMTKPR